MDHPWSSSLAPLLPTCTEVGQEVTPHAHVQRAVPGLLETVSGVVVRSEHHYLVPCILQTDCCIHNQSFCSADAQIRVNKGDAQLLVVVVPVAAMLLLLVHAGCFLSQRHDVFP